MIQRFAISSSRCHFAMTVVLPYGPNAAVHLDVPPEALVAVCDAPRGAPLDDPASAAAAALTSPLDFPPLSQATVPGDKVAIALDGGVPQAAAIVSAVAGALVERGIEPRDLLVLRTQADVDAGVNDPRGRLPAQVRDQVALATHDPQDRSQLAYLAANRKGRPILLNRLLFDADFVVPIGCLDLASIAGYHGRHDGLFPTFSDAESAERFRALDVAAVSDHSSQRTRREADEAGWLLGVSFTVQVIPGGGGRLLHVLAGNVDAVFEQGQALCEAAWRYAVPRQAGLVIAALRDEPEQQTWQQVGRAAEAAARVVADDGAIAICTELEIKPGRAVRKIGRAHDLPAARRQISQERAADALPATQLALAMEKARVYLLSRLDESTVEDLGLVPVSDSADIARLAGRHESCIVLENAQHVFAETPCRT
jgi:nickel-dependent lactate racemase